MDLPNVCGLSASLGRTLSYTGVCGRKCPDKKIALTFDDGPHPVYTEQILDGLKKRNVKSTFFILGEQAELYPDIVKRMGKEGHLIGNHTYSHLQYSSSRELEFGQELVKTNEILKDITVQD